MTKHTGSITIILTMSMQRITFSLPKDIYQELVGLLPAGEVSKFVTRAVEKELLAFSFDPIEDFIELGKKLPKRKKEAILKAIRRGRK